MSKKKSSFRMGNEFNGYGEMTYLKASEHKTYAPLSQKNVRLTPDFSSLLPKMLGIASVIMDPKSIENSLIIKYSEGTAIANQVILKKDESSEEYIAQVQVTGLGLMTGSYLQSRTSASEVIIVNPGIHPGWEEQANGGWKYINESGAYIKSDWKQHKGKWYYLNSDEYMVTDWNKISRKWYYFKPGQDNGYMVLGWRKIKDKWYYFKEEEEAGYMVLGWRKIKDKWYYFKKEEEAGYMVIGWRMIDEKWYYFEQDGHMVTDWQEIAGKKYYFYEDGHCAISEYIEDINTGITYYADANGVCTPSVQNPTSGLKPFANMTLQQKKNYIFQYDYSTEKKAEGHMTKITFPIWTYENNDPNKRKIEKTRNMRVNKLVADDLINIFNEIFNDSEQFPIYYYSKGGYYQVEGFHYRNSMGGSKPSVHSYGAAVDINALHNAYKIVPSPSPFKIESTGSVVRIFSEHGWYWGGDFSTAYLDYMHFTLIEEGANSRI